MEFKADEADACRLALHTLGRSEPGVGTYFATSGTISSLGISFHSSLHLRTGGSPAIGRNPIAAAGFIAVTNVVAVWLSYVAGRRYFSPRVGVISAALFALSPSAIVCSCKIWSPNLIPDPFTLILIALFVERRARGALWLILLVGVALQFHFSGAVPFVLVGAAFVIGRDTLGWHYLAIGLGGVAVPYAPDLSLQVLSPRLPVGTQSFSGR
jgi:hypothetical protein